MILMLRLFSLLAMIYYHHYTTLLMLRCRRRFSLAAAAPPYAITLLASMLMPFRRFRRRDAEFILMAFFSSSFRFSFISSTMPPFHDA